LETRRIDAFIYVEISQNGEIIENFSVQDSAYPSGRFGFYNFSQSDVIYNGFTRAIASQGEYRYSAAAEDAEGDALTYSIVSGPDGLTIDPTTGVVSWSLDTVSGC